MSDTIKTYIEQRFINSRDVFFTPHHTLIKEIWQYQSGQNKNISRGTHIYAMHLKDLTVLHSYSINHFHTLDLIIWFQRLPVCTIYSSSHCHITAQNWHPIACQFKLWPSGSVFVIIVLRISPYYIEPGHSIDKAFMAVISDLEYTYLVLVWHEMRCLFHNWFSQIRPYLIE